MNAHIISVAVHGGWSDIELWMPCKNGQKKGFRYCTNPEPAHGGNNCYGDNFIIQTCNSTFEGMYSFFKQFVLCQEFVKKKMV